MISGLPLRISKSVSWKAVSSGALTGLQRSLLLESPEVFRI